ncbi:MAG: MATE family efflux transporter [Dehalococcoidales bacterium]|nr:MATE family efflux transporter [Dehalococcoidales bacterium]
MASYILVDSIFVGRLGTEALAALAVANPLMAIYRAVTMGIGVGVASLISRRLGAGDEEGANRAAAGGITLFFMVGTVVTVICLLNLEALLRLFGAGGLVLPLAKDYMFIETCFMLLDFFIIILAELVRVEGNPVLSSASMIIAGLMNCVWDPILGFGLGPFPKMGMMGFALATSVGRGIGVLILMVYLLSGKSLYRFKPGYFLPNIKIAGEIYRVGVSMTARQASGSISAILATRTAAYFGHIPLAIVGILWRASSFAFTPCWGLGQGMLPIVGFNFGAHKKERVGEAVVKAGLSGLLWGVLWWLVVMLFPAQIMSLFDTDPAFLTTAIPAFRIYALVLFTVGPQMILSYFFQGIGKGLASLVVSSSRQLIFLIPCLLIMPRMFGINGLWAAYSTADALSMVLTLIWVFVEFRRQEIPFRFKSNHVID